MSPAEGQTLWSAGVTSRVLVSSASPMHGPLVDMCQHHKLYTFFFQVDGVEKVLTTFFKLTTMYSNSWRNTTGLR